MGFQRQEDVVLAENCWMLRRRSLQRIHCALFLSMNGEIQRGALEVVGENLRVSGWLRGQLGIRRETPAAQNCPEGLQSAASHHPPLAGKQRQDHGAGRGPVVTGKVLRHREIHLRGQGQLDCDLLSHVELGGLSCRSSCWISFRRTECCWSHWFLVISTSEL